MRDTGKPWLRRHLVAVLALKFLFLALLWLVFRHGAPPVDSQAAGDAVLRAAPAAAAAAKEPVHVRPAR